MKRAIIGAGALLALGAILAPGQALAGRTAATLTIEYDSTDGMGNYAYQGSVDSLKSKCQSPRKITLYRDEAGDDQKIGSDTSIPNFLVPDKPALWGISDADEGGPGTYYATTPKTKKCKKAVSADYQISG
jgi:hypothetical protein